MKYWVLTIATDFTFDTEEEARSAMSSNAVEKLCDGMWASADQVGMDPPALVSVRVEEGEDE